MSMEPDTIPNHLFDALRAGDETGTLARLHARLAGDAEAAELLDISYRQLDSPVGNLLLAATDRGLVRVAYASEGHDRVLEQLSKQISPRILRDRARLDEAARELDEYFRGTRRTFDLPLDLRLASGFRRHVLEGLPSLAYGHTASYSDVAQQAGSPRAVRAVGTACATNPLPLVVPCHRVIRSDGQIGNYAGGVGAKRALLTLEGAIAT